MINLLEYFDYHQFLQAYIALKKKQNTAYSYRYFASKFAMDHSNFIKVLLGKRELSAKNAEAISTALKFNAKEAKYFRTLVEFNKAKSQAKSKVLFERLIALKNSDLQKLESFQYDYYRQWYHSAIYSIIDYYEFRGDFAALAAELNPVITQAQAKESIDLLKKLELIRMDESGRYIQTQKMLTTGSLWHSTAIQSFQEETLNLAIQSLLHQNRKVRNISTLTMSVSKSEMLIIRELTEQYRKSVIQVVNEGEKGDSVYQLNIQLFPMTKNKWDLP